MVNQRKLQSKRSVVFNGYTWVLVEFFLMRFYRILQDLKKCVKRVFEPTTSYLRVRGASIVSQRHRQQREHLI